MPDCRFKRAQALVDRQQLYDSRPGINQILKRIADLVEGGQNLLQYAEGNCTHRDCRYQKHINEYIVSLHVQHARNIEVHVVEIEAEVAFADVGKQLPECLRLGS